MGARACGGPVVNNYTAAVGTTDVSILAAICPSSQIDDGAPDGDFCVRCRRCGRVIQQRHAFTHIDTDAGTGGTVLEEVCAGESSIGTVLPFGGFGLGAQ